jgi:hypothetical protein
MDLAQFVERSLGLSRKQLRALGRGQERIVERPPLASGEMLETHSQAGQ